MNPQTIVLFLIAFLVGSDEFLLGPILTPVGSDLGVVPERITLFIGAYALPLALLAPVLGGLSDRFGRQNVLLPGVGLFCLGSLGTALASSYEFALLTRVVTGIGAAGMLPVAFATAADSGPERAPANIAAVQAGLTGGIILAPLYGAWMTETVGWQYAFAGLAIAGILSVLGIGWLGKTKSEFTPPTPKGSVLVPGALGAIVAMGFGLGGAIGIYALVGERLRDTTDITTSGIGLIYAGFGAVTLLGNLLMPWALKKVSDGRQLMQISLIGVMLSIVALFSLQLGTLTACLALGIWALLGGTGAPGLQTYLASLSETRRGVLMALGASAMNFGVAAWSAVAAFGFEYAPMAVAAQAVLTIGTGILALAQGATLKRELDQT
ncbi:Predicted arabinose efflux permease, MFS family [Cohaesibacter sp. ES.047]|uniref:MFS transporter n=1 Tax=Cohaesibacter sp. ES.047 TaxID=1798205 RepID=UPI000BC041FE|nr:MFS transporter [Cohaesibacter sp. ES.047]SNY90090.1 Predicted arabinose efflux permease, MFS family [Cohaesibacter sp. ES.047]